MKHVIAVIVLTISLLFLPIEAGAQKLSKEEAQLVKIDALKNWFAEDGTMLLNPNEWREPFAGFEKTTAGNDNAILFAAEFYWLLEAHGLLEAGDAFRFEDTVADLVAHGQRGLYHRNPGRTDRYEAHDNYVGVVAGSTLFGLSLGADVIRYGETHGWTYNNLAPDETGISYIRFWRQPGEVAFYHLASYSQPDVFGFVWLFGSAVVSAFTASDNASGHLLDWLRFKAMDKSCAQKPNWMCQALYPAKRFWISRLKSKTNGLGMEHFFKLYFGGRNPANPLEKLSQGIVY